MRWSRLKCAIHISILRFSNSSRCTLKTLAPLAMPIIHIPEEQGLSLAKCLLCSWKSCLARQNVRFQFPLHGNDDRTGANVLAPIAEFARNKMCLAFCIGVLQCPLGHTVHNCSSQCYKESYLKLLQIVTLPLHTMLLIRPACIPFRRSVWHAASC